jgi:hypothetical protein
MDKSREDCNPFDPQKLEILDEGPDGWILLDPTSRLKLLDNEADATLALAVARRHTHQCFIGRNNARGANRLLYIFHYFKGDSKLDSELPHEDCISYDPGSLSIVDEGPNGWLLTDGITRMHMLDSEADAEAALAIAKRHSAHCFIGRNNTRPNRLFYIMEYWQ